LRWEYLKKFEKAGRIMMDKRLEGLNKQEKSGFLSVICAKKIPCI
jgi:hypothetical protein